MVKRFDGSETTLSLAGAAVQPFELSYRQSILLTLIDPNLAFILLVLGLVGVYVEFSNPGLIFPGVAGAILVILGAMALTVLPLNWAAAALIVLGLVFFRPRSNHDNQRNSRRRWCRRHGPGRGDAGRYGHPRTLDQLGYRRGRDPALRRDYGLPASTCRPVIPGEGGHRCAGMIGEIGVAKTDVFAKGRVFVHGEWWNAASDAPIPMGSSVRIVGIDDLKLRVEPESSDAASEPIAGSTGQT